MMRAVLVRVVLGALVVQAVHVVRVAGAVVAAVAAAAVAVVAVAVAVAVAPRFRCPARRPC
jgi:hypothetical protein